MFYIIAAIFACAGVFTFGWSLGFNHCARQLEDWEDADWQEVQGDD